MSNLNLDLPRPYLIHDTDYCILKISVVLPNSGMLSERIKILLPSHISTYLMRLGITEGYFVFYRQTVLHVRTIFFSPHFLCPKVNNSFPLKFQRLLSSSSTVFRPICGPWSPRSPYSSLVSSLLPLQPLYQCKTKVWFFQEELSKTLSCDAAGTCN